MILNKLGNKKVLILGLGREGLASFLFLRKLFPNKIIGLADAKKFKDLSYGIKKLIKNDGKITLHSGKDYLKTLNNYDVVIKSPGIPPKIINPYVKKNAQITSQTEIFFENCPGTIIGITGTKGKSTVSTLIYKVLKAGGIPDIHLVGNIGKPVIAFLEKANKKSIFVYELSSHQLSGLKKSPHIAVLLGIFPEHLDYYKNFNEYVSAKKNIALWQKKNDILIFNNQNEISKKIAANSLAKKLSFSDIVPKEFDFQGCCIKNGAIFYFEGKNSEQKILDISSLKLAGYFNAINTMPAIIIGKIFGIPLKKITNAIKNFKGLSHRLEFIGKYRGIKFYNDSLATIPEATINALDALGDDVETLILGGYDRGLNFLNLAKRIIASSVKNLIFFPTTGERIWSEIKTIKKERQVPLKYFFIDNMEKAVSLAYKNTISGKICLLSCASPSFGIFKDYKERGNLFKRYVNLARNHASACAPEGSLRRAISNEVKKYDKIQQ